MRHTYDPSSRESLEKLRAQLTAAQTTSERYRLALRFKEHPKRGEIFRLLETLSKDSEAEVRLRSIEVLARSFSDLPRTVNTLTRAAGAEMSWDRFQEIASVRQWLSVNKERYVAALIDLMKPHLESDQITLPLRESAREKEAKLALGLSAYLRRFRKVLQGQARSAVLEQEAQAAFKRLHKRLSSELRSRKSREAWRAPRTRKERIQGLLDGEEELTHELFQMLTARDGFANLKQLIKLRPEAIKSYQKHLQPEAPFTDEQVAELWSLMDEALREKLGVGILRKSGKYLQRQTLFDIAEGGRPVADLALDLLGESKPDAEEQERVKKLLVIHPDLEASVWQAFSRILRPTRKCFPRWSYQLKASSAIAVLEGEHFYLSTHRSLSCLTVDSGRIVWEYRELGLPMVHYPLGERLFLGQQEDQTICLVECTGVRLQRKPFEGPSLRLAQTMRPQFGMGCVNLSVWSRPDTHHGEGELDNFSFDLKSLKIEKKHYSGQTAPWQGQRLLHPGPWSQKCLLSADGNAICVGPEKKIYAFEYAGEGAPAYTSSFSQDKVFGFDESEGKLAFRCWARRG